jgi:hypothetical protein
MTAQWWSPGALIRGTTPDPIFGRGGAAGSLAVLRQHFSHRRWPGALVGDVPAGQGPPAADLRHHRLMR